MYYKIILKTLLKRIRAFLLIKSLETNNRQRGEDNLKEIKDYFKSTKTLIAEV